MMQLSLDFSGSLRTAADAQHVLSAVSTPDSATCALTGPEKRSGGHSGGILSVSDLIDAVGRYRQRPDERLVEWAARAPAERRGIVNAFLAPGGVIWCERNKVRAELAGHMAREPNRDPDEHHDFLPVLRWVENEPLRRHFREVKG